MAKSAEKGARGSGLGWYLELVPDAKGSEGMLTVDHYELIRRKVEIDGQTQRDVAKELGHSRKTVAKALKLRIPPGYRLSEPRPRPAIEPERLRDEYGFKGHYGTVQRYVKQAANRQKEVFMPLQFEPSEEAQVDWHEGWIFENGVERKCQFFVMKL